MAIAQPRPSQTPAQPRPLQSPAQSRALQAPAQWPNSSNTGYSNAPGYPGSLTPWLGGSLISGTAENPTIYSFYDFQNSEGALAVSGKSYITFLGCRFGSRYWPAGGFNGGWANVYLDSCDHITFSYCTVAPLISVRSQPPNAAWPSAGAGSDIVPDSSNAADYMSPAEECYQYGFRIYNGADDITIDHCDIWGYGNAIDIHLCSNIAIADCWIHDASFSNVSPPLDYHTDGIGYLDGATPPDNVTVEHCTIATLGNTNGIAFQAATSGYSFITVNNCYLSGFGYCVDMCHSGQHGTPNGDHLIFTNNIFASDIRWIFGPLYPVTNVWTATFPTNVWSGNKFKVYPGTSPAPESWSWNPDDDGKFLWPDGTLNNSDWIP